MSVAREIAPHVVHHPMEEIPSRELTRLDFLSPVQLADEDWTAAWIYIGGLPFRYDDVTADMGRFYVQMIQSKTRGHLVGATGQLVAPVPNRKWKVLLDKSQEHGISTDSLEIFADHNLGIGLETRRPSPLTTSLLLHACEQWLTKDDIICGLCRYIARQETMSLGSVIGIAYRERKTLLEYAGRDLEHLLSGPATAIET